MKLRLILTLLIFSMAIKMANSQEKVNLLNGKILEGTIQSTEDEKITMKVNEKKEKYMTLILKIIEYFQSLALMALKKLFISKILLLEIF